MNNTGFPYKILFWVTVFAIAMGFLETSVVVYIRALLYPQGFGFPLATIPQNLAVTEIFREAATIVMLVGIGILAGKKGITRFAWFIYAFAIWDIFYYVFLKVLLNWPESLFTWDILFLIPVVWTGPVITPVILSFTMILLTILIIHFNTGNRTGKMNSGEWSLLIAGSVIAIVSFAWDYSAFILKHYSFSEIWQVPSNDLLVLAQQYVPVKFNWLLFWLGEIIILCGIYFFWHRVRKTLK